MNLTALVGAQRFTDDIKALKADSIGFCILKAVQTTSPDGEPWRVRRAAEELRGRVITDGAFFGTVNRLKGNDYVHMVRYRREVRVGASTRYESVGVYRLTERGNRCLSVSEHKLDEAERLALEEKSSGALTSSGFIHQP